MGNLESVPIGSPFLSVRLVLKYTTAGFSGEPQGAVPSDKNVDAITDKLRNGGKMHEWLPVSQAVTAKKWG